MAESIDTIIAWHKQTFPDETLAGQKDKYIEELNECLWADPKDELSELADMIIVSAGIMRFDPAQYRYLDCAYRLAVAFGYDFDDLWQAVDKKMQTNRARKWVKQAEGNYHHV